VELGLANTLYNHLSTSLINMNLENPLHLLYITMPFDLPTMTIGFRQLVDRVNLQQIPFSIELSHLDTRDEN
jgi:hypothetical protein